MAAQFTYSQVIDRPIADVFHFFAIDHVRNHPRWDPDIELNKTSDEPMGVGTVISRRNRRFGAPVDGSMEVVEYLPNQVIAMKIKDGGNDSFGRTTFEALGDHRTTMTTFVEIPWMEDTTEMRAFMMNRLERSGQNMKRLMEAEIDG